jgi:selenocysteine-specific elongation factor
VTVTQVIATAGHVDHGKSTLVRALTGMEPDRWEEERRRGLTIDLGFAWMDEPDGPRVAFVDVPGHERFVPNMLAGLGPVPAVLMVVAADGGWMPQSAEHLAAIDALGISHGLLAITRADLADPGPALRRARAELAATSLGQVEAVAVSAVTGAGLPELRRALARLAAALPVPDPAGPVRLWVDRAFSIRGSGTVVTGTLPAGTVRVGGELLLTPALRPVRVRAIESLNRPADQVHGVARVALNLRGLPRDIPGRGMALVEADRWTLTSTVDVRCQLPAGLDRLPRELAVHIGSARTPATVRALGPTPPVTPVTPAAPETTGIPGGTRGTLLARLSLRDPLPLHVGDRLLLRDPGAAGLLILGAVVLDVAPPRLARRGAAAAAATELAQWPTPPRPADLLARHKLLRQGALTAMGLGGVDGDGGAGGDGGDGGGGEGDRDGGGLAPVAGDWLADPAFWTAARERLTRLVTEHAAQNPLAVGLPVEAARAALQLPTRSLVEALARPVPGQTSPEAVGRPIPGQTSPEARARSAPGNASREAVGRPASTETPADARARPVPGQAPAVTLRDGYLILAQPGDSGPTRAPSVPEPLLAAVRTVRSDLATDPFRAPEADRLRELGLDTKSIAAAARAGLLLRVSDQIVLAPGADTAAAQALARLPQPFTTAEARQALSTTRRVAIPLLEYLDRARITERLPDDRRRLRSS